ncbi:hypothetical protein E2C01_019712 [Portunus trituberculatus]|uniref:Uncharacterized protein n=1 Tax=Portunus trituberculatus TaxID=210409 RepID=A0A5B7DY65_PORTR|nr:hypothetical protein [Portunus trituberculatus]
MTLYKTQRIKQRQQRPRLNAKTDDPIHKLDSQDYRRRVRALTVLHKAQLHLIELRVSWRKSERSTRRHSSMCQGAAQ